MVLHLTECLEHMTEDEKKIYEEKSANEFFRYISSSNSFQEAVNRLEEDDWKYLFEKLYLVTYKSLFEENTVHIFDGVLTLFCKIGMMFSQKGTPEYNEYYKMLQMSQSVSRTKEVNDDLLFGLEKLVNSSDEKFLEILLQQHEEACLLRSHRDYLYEQDLKSQDGELSSEEIVAINCFNRSYEREKELVLKYKNVL